MIQVSILRQPILGPNFPLNFENGYKTLCSVIVVY